MFTNAGQVVAHGQARVDAVNQWFVQAVVREGESAVMSRAGAGNPLPFKVFKVHSRVDHGLGWQQWFAALAADELS